ARVRVDLRPEAGVGGGGRLPSDRTCSHRGIGAEGYLAAVDALDALRCGEHQHDVGELHAPLPAEAAASHGDEHRVREAAVFVAHDEYAMSAAPAEEEGRLGHIGKHWDSISALEEAIRNPPVACGADVRQDLAGVEQTAFLACLGVDGGCRDGESERSQQRNDRTAYVHGETSPPFLGCRRLPT